MSWTALVYAGALVAEADQLISENKYLQKTVNRIKTSPLPRAGRSRLEKRVAAILSRQPGTLTFPDAIRIPSQGR